MDRIENLRENFEFLKGCCMRNTMWTPDEVTEVILFAEDGYDSGGVWRALDEYGGGSEAEALAIVKLNTGEYGLLDSSEDYTGHGCQCGSHTGRYPNLETLMQMGIEEYRREEISALLP